MTLPTATPQPINVTPGAPRMGAAKPSQGRLLIAALVALVLLVLVWKLVFHESQAVHLATDVTKAIANNDMRPVESDFNALRRPELVNRAKVGRLSDFVNADGSFKSVTEDTPSGSPAGYHHFIAHFSNGDLQERMLLDADGKIARFDVKPIDAASGSQ